MPVHVIDMLKGEGRMDGAKPVLKRSCCLLCVPDQAMYQDASMKPVDRVIH